MHAPRTRRAFMKGGALRLWPRRPAPPRFLVRAAQGAGAARQGAGRGLPARRGGRAQHGGAARRPGYYAARGQHRASRRPRRGRRRHRARSRRLLRAAPGAGAAEAAVGRTTLADRARLRLARHHALALRRAGLHGIRDARREEHARRLAGARAPAALPADAASPFRAVALGPRLPRVPARRRGRGGDELLAGFDVPTPGASRGGGRAARLRVAVRARACSDLLHGTGRETFEAVKMLKSAEPAASHAGQRRATIRAAASARACARSPSSCAPTSGSRSRSPRSSGWDTHAAQGAERGQLAQPARASSAPRLAAFDRDLGDRMADVVVLTMSEFGRTVARERQPRHRSRPRHRHARAGRRRARRPRLRPLAGPRAPSNASRAATSPSPPTSAPCSTRSPPATSPCRRRPRSSPAGPRLPARSACSPSKTARL